MENDLDERTAAVIRDAVADAFKLFAKGLPPISSPPALAAPEEPIRKIVRSEIETLMEDIGLPIDKEHKAETRRNIEGIISARKSAVGFGKTVLGALALGLATWIASHFGIKIGDSH